MYLYMYTYTHIIVVAIMCKAMCFVVLCFSMTLFFFSMLAVGRAGSMIRQFHAASHIKHSCMQLCSVFVCIMSYCCSSGVSVVFAAGSVSCCVFLQIGYTKYSSYIDKY